MNFITKLEFVTKQIKQMYIFDKRSIKKKQQKKTFFDDKLSFLAISATHN